MTVPYITEHLSKVNQSAVRYIAIQYILYTSAAAAAILCCCAAAGPPRRAFMSNSLMAPFPARSRAVKSFHKVLVLVNREIVKNLNYNIYSTDKERDIKKQNIMYW